MRLSIFLCLVFGLSSRAFSPALNTALDVAGLTKDAVTVLWKTWSLINHNMALDDVPVPFLRRSEDQTFHAIRIVNENINRVSRQFATMDSSGVLTFLKGLPQRLRFELHLNELFSYLTLIDIRHEEMQKYVEFRDELERATLLDFARTILSHDSDSTVSILKRINAVFLSEDTQFNGILMLLSKQFKEIESGVLCDALQSPQQILYNLYNTIALSELKGYAMVQFSYMLQKLYNNANYTKEVELRHKEYQERVNFLVTSVKGVMTSASRELYKCQTNDHEVGRTYEEITQLLQGYVQNEVDMNPEGTCGENCQAYKYTKSHSCFKNLYCSKQRPCKGQIMDCRFYDSDMWICPSQDPSRRYNYIEYENGRILGTNLRGQNCPKGATTKVDSWWRWLFWHCSYCFCLCDEQGPLSDRYFNMRPSLSNITNNQVVTGIRFKKHNRIIHLQVQQGQLLPFGNINKTTLSWIEPENYKLTDRNVKTGQHFHTLTWKDRAMDLDDLEAPPGHVLTGVRFQHIGSHLNFQIYVTPFNFKTGQLIQPLEKSHWIENLSTELTNKDPRKRLQLYNPNIPTRLTGVSSKKIITAKNKYVEFTHTDVNFDVAQTTVPFLDAQPLESAHPVPLAGAGIFHQGALDSGGFITPKIITYDFSNELNPEDVEEVN